MGEWGNGYLCLTSYSLHCHHQNDCIKAGICVGHLNVSFIVWSKSQDNVHEPQFLKRNENRSGSNRGRSAYQPCALPLGHTSSHDRDNGDSHKNTQSATQTRLADRNAKPAPCVGIRLANLKHIVHHSDSAYVWQPTTLF